MRWIGRLRGVSERMPVLHAHKGTGCKPTAPVLPGHVNLPKHRRVTHGARRGRTRHADVLERELVLAPHANPLWKPSLNAVRAPARKWGPRQLRSTTSICGSPRASSGYAADAGPHAVLGDGGHGGGDAAWSQLARSRRVSVRLASSAKLRAAAAAMAPAYDSSSADCVAAVK